MDEVSRDPDRASILLIAPLDGDRLDRALASVAPAGLSRSRLTALIREGAVTRDGEAVTDPKSKVKAGQAYAVAVPAAAPPDPQPEDVPLSVLYEDEHLIVVDKPAGMVVHPAPGAEAGTLVNALLHHCG
ncbi:MAG: S4 domain-containing protein, partial [Pseudomonadota bacterium]